MQNRSFALPGAALSLLAAAIVSPAAIAQIDLSGGWANQMHEDRLERGPGPEIGDFTGLPINDAARSRGMSWDASLLTVPEHQCGPHPANYGAMHSNIRLTKEIDRESQNIVAWHLLHESWNRFRTIWMDGRPHPGADERHTWQGFSTGRWVNNLLQITTTDMKESRIRRNGIEHSDEGVLIEYLARHDDILTFISILDDPHSLDEPYIHTRNFTIDPNQFERPYPCRGAVEIDRPPGVIPHHLPGRNPFLETFQTNHGIPAEAALGGAETVFPEYRQRLRELFAAQRGTGQGSDRQSNDQQSSAQQGDARGVQQHAAPGAGARPGSTGEQGLRVTRVADGIHMISGAGGNVTVSVGDSGVMLVDAGSSDMSDALLDAIAGISDRPIRYIINSTAHPEHTGGNAAVRLAGATFTGGNATVVGGVDVGAAIVGHERTLFRLVDGPDFEPDALPTETFFVPKHDLYFNGEPVVIMYQPEANDDTNLVVHFRRSDVISAGDVFRLDTYPVIDLDNGGSIDGVLASLNGLVDLAVSDTLAEGGTLIVPGHGRICDEGDLVRYRDMVTVIRDRIAAMVDEGASLDEIMAAQPTLDYESRWGSDSGPWTTSMFIEAVYLSLGGGRPASGSES